MDSKRPRNEQEPTHLRVVGTAELFSSEQKSYPKFLQYSLTIEGTPETNILETFESAVRKDLASTSYFIQKISYTNIYILSQDSVDLTNTVKKEVWF